MQNDEAKKSQVYGTVVGPILKKISAEYGTKYDFPMKSPRQIDYADDNSSPEAFSRP